MSANIIGLLKNSSSVIGTVESLTSGMIVSSLVDNPGTSSVVYGGIATYMSSAKQKLAGVTLPGTIGQKNHDKDVYTYICAKQMSEGLLNKMLGDNILKKNNYYVIAVTGHAGPYYNWSSNSSYNPVNDWGKVHISVSTAKIIRNDQIPTLNNPKTRNHNGSIFENNDTIKINTTVESFDLCEEIQNVCGLIKNNRAELRENPKNSNKIENDKNLRNIIRNICTTNAFEFLEKILRN